jgi:single-strand DNA-binding protein
MNQYNVIGNLGKDPELRYAQSGTAVCKFTVATKAGWGENESTTWVNCVCFGKKAEAIEKFFSKGSKIAVSGEIKTDSYEKDGVTRYTWELNVRDFYFVESKGGGSSTPGPEPAPAFNDDDIPF